MSVDVGVEAGLSNPTPERDGGMQSFLQVSETSARMVRELGCFGFQLGGGAVDFALGRYRRPHKDVDMVYVVGEGNWSDYLLNPLGVAAETSRLRDMGRESGGSVTRTPLAMERTGVSGVRMDGGGDFPIRVDFLEAYRHEENGEEYVMLSLYVGGSYIKIPLREIVEREIDGVAVRVPTVEVQLIMREQCANVLESVKGGLFPDWRRKARQDMRELRGQADPAKLAELKQRGVGFNFSLGATVSFNATRLFRAVA